MYHLRYIGGSNLYLSDGLKHGCILHQNIIQNAPKDRMHNFVYVTKAYRPHAYSCGHASEYPVEHLTISFCAVIA